MFFNIKVFCVISLESPPHGESNEYTQYSIFNIKRKITLTYLKSVALRFCLRIQERVRTSHGKRAISVQATEVLLYIGPNSITVSWLTNYQTAAEGHYATILWCSIR